MKILILNGPNLCELGKRETDIYGVLTLDSIIEKVGLRAKACGVDLESYQSNVEGELVSRVLECRDKIDGIIFNPAAYTHTSIALRDALQAVKVPCVEVHLSNTAARDDFRHTSFTASACIGQIMGLGAFGYELALLALVEHVESCKVK